MQRRTNKIEDCGVYFKLFFYSSEGYVLVDAVDYPIVKDYCWSKECTPTKGLFYSKAYGRGKHGTTNIRMHQVLTNYKPPSIVEHINGNGLDNRRENLRIATNCQNMMNRRKHKNNTTGTTGVYFEKESKTWRARIQANKVDISLGTFPTKEVAVEARLKAEELYFGEYRRDKEAT